MTSGKLNAVRRRGHRRGGAILEMSLTLAVLLNLTFGMVEFGYYFYVKNMFDGAARVGVRTAITPATSSYSTVTTAVNNALSSSKLPANSWTTTVTDSSGTTYSAGNWPPAGGTVLTVQVSGTWSTVGAGFRPLNLIGSSKTVTGLCVMQHE